MPLPKVKRRQSPSIKGAEKAIEKESNSQACHKTVSNMQKKRWFLKPV
jgi:hypothetical protein